MIMRPTPNLRQGRAPTSLIGSHQRLEPLKNPDYWNKDHIPNPDRLVLMPGATTRAAALVSGGIDFVEVPSPDTIPRLKGGGNEHHNAALSAQLAIPAQLPDWAVFRPAGAPGGQL